MTWYISQMDAEQAEAMGKAFTAANPSIREEVVWVTGQVALQRLKMDIENTTPHCDGFSASDISHMAILKDRGQLMHYTAANAGDAADGRGVPGVAHLRPRCISWHRQGSSDCGRSGGRRGGGGASAGSTAAGRGEDDPVVGARDPKGRARDYREVAGCVRELGIIAAYRRDTHAG